MNKALRRVRLQEHLRRWQRRERRARCVGVPLHTCLLTLISWVGVSSSSSSSRCGSPKLGTARRSRPPVCAATPLRCVTATTSLPLSRAWTSAPNSLIAQAINSGRPAAAPTRRLSTEPVRALRCALLGLSPGGYKGCLAWCWVGKDLRTVATLVALPRWPAAPPRGPAAPPPGAAAAGWERDGACLGGSGGRQGAADWLGRGRRRCTRARVRAPEPPFGCLALVLLVHHPQAPPLHVPASARSVLLLAAAAAAAALAPGAHAFDAAAWTLPDGFVIQPYFYDTTPNARSLALSSNQPETIVYASSMTFDGTPSSVRGARCSCCVHQLWRARWRREQREQTLGACSLSHAAAAAAAGGVGGQCNAALASPALLMLLMLAAPCAHTDLRSG